MLKNIGSASPLQFIILLGIVSFFADIAYEGARSISGPYLATLHATGAIVGTVAGIGELIGYAFRILSGYISDRTGKYWGMTFLGYAINMLAIPLLAFANSWQTASFLIILERFGKAIRTPSRDAMLSYATKQTGRGWGFGLHKAMDQAGAILGPIIITLVLYFHGSYREGFAILIVPVIACLISLGLAWSRYPNPQDLEPQTHHLKSKGFSKSYWYFVAGVSFVGAGYIDFSLIAFHFQKNGVLSKIWIPILYSIAMGTSGLSALFLGRLYDKIGLKILFFTTPLASLFAPLVFENGFITALLGMVLWGMGMGAQESLMRAEVANLVSVERRGTAYGILNLCFGVSWFLGSVLMGFLYDYSLPFLIVISLFLQMTAIPFFMLVKTNLQAR